MVPIAGEYPRKRGSDPDGKFDCISYFCFLWLSYKEHLTFSLNRICSALGLASAGFTRYIVFFAARF